MGKYLIDAGHCVSGADTGAHYHGRKEEIMTRELANLIKDLLEQEGHEAIFIHYDHSISVNDSLDKRVAYANKVGGDLCICLHFNAYNGEAFGAEVYTINSKSKAYPIAGRVHSKLSNGIFFGRGVKHANFRLLTDTSMPCVYVETCFMDNKKELATYEAKKKLVAEAIVSGVLNKTVKFKADTPITPNSKVRYRVVCGSFSVRGNALERIKEVEAKTGLDCFLDAYKVE